MPSAAAPAAKAPPVVQASAPAPSVASAPAAADAAGETEGAGSLGQVNVLPFQVPVEGPIEYEEGADKPLVATFPKAPQPEARPTIANLPTDDAVIGDPLVIDGAVVPFDQIKKEVCLGSIGVPEIQLAKIEIFIAEERQRLTEGGAPPERLDLGPQEVEEYLGTVAKSLKEEFPDGELQVQDLLNGLSSTDPRRKLRTEMLFAKLFLPDDPANFPPLTLEAILKQQGGQITLDHYKTIYEEGLASGDGIQRDPAQTQFDQVILQQVLAHITDVSSIVPDPAPGVLYRVNGVDITTDQIWERIKARVTGWTCSSRNSGS
jgi:hypothetical protein